MRGYNCFSGLKDNGLAIINGEEELQIPKLKVGQRAFVLPASDIALKTIGRPLANTTLIGAFAAASGSLKLETLLEVVKANFSGKVQEGNLEAVKQGYEYVRAINSKTSKE